MAALNELNSSERSRLLLRGCKYTEQDAHMCIFDNLERRDTNDKQHFKPGNCSAGAALVIT